MPSIEFSQRKDGKYNIWHWVRSHDLYHIDGEPASTWEVVKVVSTREEAVNEVRALRRARRA